MDTLYSGKLKDELLDRLFDAVLQLKTRDECYQFFEDICTVAELSPLPKGWKWPKCSRKTGPTEKLQEEPAQARLPSAG